MQKVDYVNETLELNAKLNFAEAADLQEVLQRALTNSMVDSNTLETAKFLILAEKLGIHVHEDDLEAATAPNDSPTSMDGPDLDETDSSIVE